MRISEEELREMARFYCKKLFFGLPEIEVSFNDEYPGVFIIDMNDDYDESVDELVNEYYYKPRYKYLGNGVGHYLNRDFSWMDPENNPDIKILIKQSYADNMRKLVATLLHELAHYYLWYCGYEHHDEDRDFLNLCHKMGLPTNFDFEWNKERKEYVYTYDYSLVDKYIEMYEGRAAA